MWTVQFLQQLIITESYFSGKTKILSILIAAVIGGRSLLGQKMVGKAITASISLLIFAILSGVIVV